MTKFNVLFIIILLLCNTYTFAQNEASESKKAIWLTDLNEAHKISKESSKPIFAFFTGSDWCGWCKKLKMVALDKPEFAKWAKDKVVLLEVDFPRRTQLTPELKKQNYELQRIFQVPGYPTIWLFDITEEKETGNLLFNALGKSGYPSSAQPGKEIDIFLESLDSILKGK